MILAGSLLWAGSVRAHASLVSSLPAAGATLPTAPPELVFAFTEELEPGFSKLELRNSANAVVAPGPGVVDAADSATLRLALPPLPADTYTVLWRVRSAVDGHITEGSVPFGVGVTFAGAALIPPVGTPDPATVAPPVQGRGGYAHWRHWDQQQAGVRPLAPPDVA